MRPLIILIVGLLRKIWPEKVMHTNRQVGFCHLPIQVAQVFRSPLATFMEDAGTAAGIGQHELFKEEDCASPARLSGDALWFWVLPLKGFGFRV